jgi:uncharacterized protein (TIGR00369 family)
MNEQHSKAGISMCRPDTTTYLPSYDECFVCGQNHPRGLRIRFFASQDGEVFAWFLPDAMQTGYDNLVHGGVISALLDELIGWAVSLKNDLLACTAELTVRFIRPVMPGRRYMARAMSGTGRGRLWSAEGFLMDEGGGTFAKAKGKYLLFSPEQTGSVARKLRYQTGDVPAFQRWMNT